MSDEPDKASPIESAMILPGQMLAAREAACVDFRRRVESEMLGGRKRSADHVSGFRFGWDAAIAFLRSRGTML